jgi:hypothetical protein
LVNGIAVSIHHVAWAKRIYPVAFIFNKRAPLMVNRKYAAARRVFTTVPRVNVMLNRMWLKHGE